VSERAAYRIVVRGAAALLIAGAVGALTDSWAVVVILALVGLAAAGTFTILHRPHRPAIRSAPPDRSGRDERRLLVVLDGVAGDESLPQLIRHAPVRPTHVLVLAPVEVSALQRWASDVDAAHATLETALARIALELHELDVTSAIADDEPLQAVEDAVESFGPREILVLATNARSRLATRIQARFAIPVSVAVVARPLALR
jgi:hypothetical protein